MENKGTSKYILYGFILVLLMVITFTASFFIYKYIVTNEKPESLNIIKNLIVSPTPNQTSISNTVAQNGTESFNTAYVGESYYDEIVALYPISGGDVTVTAFGLPNGLKMEVCKQEINSPIMPTPNTIVICPISGIPTKSGAFGVNINITTKDADGSQRVVESIVSLVVMD